MTLDEALYYLRAAATAWVAEHPQDSNTPKVEEALKFTRPSIIYTPKGRCSVCGSTDCRTEHYPNNRMGM